GATDDSGILLSTPALNDYLTGPNNSDYETQNEVMITDVCYQDASGSWQASQRVPYFFGDSRDPVLADTKLLDPTTNLPMTNTGGVNRSIPVDPTTWPTDQDYPDLGTGSTYANGMIDSTVDLGDQESDPTFQDSTGTIELGVYYADSNGDLQLAATVPEHFT